MDEHPNATLIRDLFAAFRNADLAAVERVVPDDAVWHFPGRRGKLAGDQVASHFDSGEGRQNARFVSERHEIGARGSASLAR